MKNTILRTSALLLGAVSLIVAGCANQNGGSATATGTGSASSDSNQQTVVKVALNGVPVPLFSFLDDKNQPAGYMIDYLKEVEKKLPEYQFQYEAVDTDSQLIGTDSGKYALAANFWFKNPEREKKYLFPEYEYGYSITALAVKEDRNDIKTLDDLAGKKLVPMTPTSGLRYIIKDYNIQHPGKEIRIEDIDRTTASDDLKLVDSGKYDATFININSFDDANNRLKLKVKIGGVISKEPVWFLYNKNQSELAKKIDAVTVQLTNDGTLSKLAEKWFDVDFFKSLDYVKQGHQFRKENK
ncbi:transporter substrate-binding domain-containing protein [Paenibacillus validus]|uniref:Transporter substrate-binding domain-containing protein n=1 Tax=Paenibacillus validus TaxID=44253 RepID=A0A7X2Z7Y1_9BACL|nr:transporter substrate-binding domain-containing protein [Paenibacillus validus]MUG69989.1 transporter substrate-binding domain-containing protein [Paenibacillus validus]